MIAALIDKLWEVAGKARFGQVLGKMCCFRGLAVIVILLIGVLTAVRLALSPVDGRESARQVEVCIPHNATCSQVAKILKQSELLRSERAFRFYARWKGLDYQLKAGEYALNSGMTVPELLDVLVEGRVAVKTFTVPEGYTTAQVAELLVSLGMVNEEEFWQAVAFGDFPYQFLEGVPPGKKRLEGYLFPDTYRVRAGATEEEILDMMLKRFSREIEELEYPELAAARGLTLHEAVTIASLVEREARLDEERPLIAGVIYNRLKISMPLQVDATVQYALGTTKPVLYYRDLEVDSPYNTYRINGLPPGPIAMPGRSSLLAAVYPAATDYLYYVARPDGSHAFAPTLEEHVINKEMYLK